MKRPNLGKRIVNSVKNIFKRPAKAESPVERKTFRSVIDKIFRREDDRQKRHEDLVKRNIEKEKQTETNIKAIEASRERVKHDIKEAISSLEWALDKKPEDLWHYAEDARDWDQSVWDYARTALEPEDIQKMEELDIDFQNLF